MAESYSCLLSLLGVTNANPLSLNVVHQWEVYCRWEATFLELDGCSGIHQYTILSKKAEELTGSNVIWVGFSHAVSSWACSKLP